MTGSMVEKLRSVTEEQGKLQEKMCMVMQKLEMVLSGRGALTRNSGLELKLRSRLDQLEKKHEIRNKIEKLRVPEKQISQLSVPDESVEEIMKVMKEQRDNIASLRKIVSQDDARIKRIENHKKMENYYKFK